MGDHRSGQACRRNIAGRYSISHRLRKISQGLYGHYNISYHKEPHFACWAKLCVHMRLLSGTLEQSCPLPSTQAPWSLPWQSLYSEKDPWCCMFCASWHHIIHLCVWWPETIHPNHSCCGEGGAHNKDRRLHCTVRCHEAVTKIGNQGNQSKPSPLCNIHCHFCGGSHFKNSCDVLKEYICDSKCILHNDGCIALPGRIPGTIAGKTFKDHLDKLLGQNPDPSPTHMTNLLLLDIFPNPITASFQLSAFTPSNRSSLLCTLNKRKVFGLEHRKHTNQSQQKMHLWSVRPPYLCLHSSNLRFQSPKKLLTIIISHWLILLQKPKMQHIVLQLLKMLP